MEFDAPSLTTREDATVVDSVFCLPLTLQQPLKTLHVVRAALSSEASTFAFPVLHVLRRKARAWLLIDGYPGDLPEVIHGILLAFFKSRSISCL